MNVKEFSNEFNVILDSYKVKNQFGETENFYSIQLDEYEKSVYLTNAQKELVLELYSGRNLIGNYSAYGLNNAKSNKTNIKNAVAQSESINPDEKKFFAIVKSSFGQRRKTLLNALSKSPYFSANKDSIRSALVQMDVDENVRGEKLSISQFAKLSELL